MITEIKIKQVKYFGDKKDITLLQNHTRDIGILTGAMESVHCLGTETLTNSNHSLCPYAAIQM